MINDTKLMLVDFSNDVNATRWRVVDDVVMGGRSDGSMSVSRNAGIGVFSGVVSLENNGGFSSIQHEIEKTSVKHHTKIVIRLKGDGKVYQFRLKAQRSNYYSYVSQFSTNGEWETVEIQLKDMFPQFRGRKLNMPNFSEEFIEQVTFLISNKKREHFKLIIDRIELK